MSGRFMLGYFVALTFVVLANAILLGFVGSEWTNWAEELGGWWILISCLEGFTVGLAFVGVASLIQDAIERKRAREELLLMGAIFGPYL